MTPLPLTLYLCDGMYHYVMVHCMFNLYLCDGMCVYLCFECTGKLLGKMWAKFFQESCDFTTPMESNL